MIKTLPKDDKITSIFYFIIIFLCAFSLAAETDQKKLPSTSIVEHFADKYSAVNPKTVEPFSLSPHRAEYKIRLIKSSNPDITDINGTGFISLIKHKMGWSFELYLQAEIITTEGNIIVLEKNVAYWESDDTFLFRVEVFRDGAEEMVISGESQKVKNNGIETWQTSFIKPKQKGFISDSDILFPIGNLRNILAAMKNNQLVIQEKSIFDPSNYAFEPLRIDGNLLKVPNKTYHIKNLSIDSEHFWQFKQIACEKTDDCFETDENTSTMLLLSNGIILNIVNIWDGCTVEINISGLTEFRKPS